MKVTPNWGHELTITVDEPTFLVEIWTSTGNAASRAWDCVETGLSQCDVREALAWAEEHTPGGGHYTLYACYIDEHQNGVMVWLAGHDPVHDVQSNHLTFTWPTE